MVVMIIMMIVINMIIGDGVNHDKMIMMVLITKKPIQIYCDVR